MSRFQKALSLLIANSIHQTKKLRTPSLLMFWMIILILGWSKLSCSPPSPENAPPKKKAQNSNFLTDLDKRLTDIATVCNYELGCYWEEGHDYIEFKACTLRRSKSAGFRSTEDCHEVSLTVLEDLVSILKIEAKKPWFRVGKASKKRRSSPSSDTEPSNPVSPSPTAIAGFCSRTAGVQTAILGQLTGVTCSTITQANLDSIVTSLTVELEHRVGDGDSGCPSQRSTLQAGDFSGLRRLRKLVLDDNCLDALPSGIFAGLGDLEEITFGQQGRLGDSASWPSDVFDGLNSMTRLKLPECSVPCSDIPSCVALKVRRGSALTVIEEC